MWQLNVWRRIDIALICFGVVFHVFLFVWTINILAKREYSDLNVMHIANELFLIYHRNAELTREKKPQRKTGKKRNFMGDFLDALWQMTSRKNTQYLLQTSNAANWISAKQNEKKSEALTFLNWIQGNAKCACTHSQTDNFFLFFHFTRALARTFGERARQAHTQ